MISTLTEILPYISKFKDKIIVIKYGGSAMLDENLQKSVMADVLLLHQCGLRPIIVHGGGNTISENSGGDPKFIDGLRYTDDSTMKVAQMTLIGDIAKKLVKLIGEKAVGISGIDGACITAEPMDVKYGLVGRIAEIDTKLITALIDNDYIPVISPIGVHEGQAYNINADTAASAIAVSLQAEKLVMLSDVDGVLNNGKLMSRIKLSEIPNLIQKGIITDSMLPKINACTEAMRLGVENVHIINGLTPHSILTETFTGGGIGTMIEGW